MLTQTKGRGVNKLSADVLALSQMTFDDIGSEQEWFHVQSEVEIELYATYLKSHPAY